ncbi:MAG TPA: DUF6049 family protein [Mycobacteriales bacterium]|jgi:hypothetical protein|nr:DUF6049 family protein [Mycobacteriales bacterium]
MSTVRRRARLALATPLLLIALALSPLASALLPATAARADTPSLPIAVTLSTLRPLAPQAGDTLTLTGTFRNTSLTPIGSVAYELKLSPGSVGSRSEFYEYAVDPDATLADQTQLIPATDVVLGDPQTLAPGQVEPFRLSVTLDATTIAQFALLPNQWQVRELGVSVTGTTPSNPVSEPVGALRTFLPWAPRNVSGTGLPTQLAWVWPMTDRPHRTLAATWFDNALEPEISGSGASTGRLSGLLAAGLAAENQRGPARRPQTVNVPITWAIDPMLVSDVQAMAAGYRISTPKGTVTGNGTTAAKAWLSQLDQAVTSASASILPLPYGDPDVTAAARYGGFATAVGLAATNGRNLMQHTYDTADILSTYAWPPGGAGNQRTLNLLSAIGAHTVVLAGTAVPVLGLEPSVTPSAHVDVATNEGPVDALLADSGLSSDVDSGVNSPQGTRLAVQHFLAEALMIQAEQPNTARQVVVAPSRRWDPAPAYAAQLLSDTGRVPWIQPVSLQQVDASTPDTSVQRKPLTYPDAARHNELAPPYLTGVAGLRDQVSTFASILPTGNGEIRDYTFAEQQALSSGWRQDPPLADKEVGALSSSLRAQMRQVRISSNAGSYVTLTSHNGKVPVTISNNLPTPVRVTVKLTGDRLVLSHHGEVVNVSVPAHQQTVVNIHAAAKTSGVFPVSVQLYTPSGTKYGVIVNLFVRSTAYGTITLIITGAATAALMVAVAIRLVRRALAARRGTTGGGTGGGSTGGGSPSTDSPAGALA